MKLEEEVRQVAAVGAAWYENLTFGQADYDRPIPQGGGSQGPAALGEIEDERRNQDQKFGAQDHPPAVYLAILLEEVGEAADLIWQSYDFRSVESPYSSLAEIVEAATTLGQKARTYLEDELGGPK